ncbi:OPT oligopeptide transporter protein-domain-containing protein, partial [Mycena rebaudengoi]
MTGQEITLNVLAQIPESLLPGNPLANTVVKLYSVQTLTEATSFLQDLKLGHYVKVSPHASFLVQLVSTFIAAFLHIGVKTWIFANVEDICQPEHKSQLTCPHNQVFFTASAVWCPPPFTPLSHCIPYATTGPHRALAAVRQEREIPYVL